MTPLLALVAALATPQSAAEYAQRGDALYMEGAFVEAGEAYASAYLDDPNPDYLYAWAQAERLAGNCPNAVELYREYAGLDVPTKARDAAYTNADKCGVDIRPAAPPPPSETPVRVQPQPQSQTRPVSDDRHPRRAAWRTDGLGLGLIAAGGAMTVAAPLLAVGSRQQRDRSANANTEAQYARTLERANQARTAAIICGSLGAAAFIAGTIRLATVQRAENRETATWRPGRGFRF
jgi:tetratricopeptide (TPR) repeat protein